MNYDVTRSHTGSVMTSAIYNIFDLLTDYNFMVLLQYNINTFVNFAVRY